MKKFFKCPFNLFAVYLLYLSTTEAGGCYIIVYFMGLVWFFLSPSGDWDANAPLKLTFHDSSVLCAYANRLLKHFFFYTHAYILVEQLAGF